MILYQHVLREFVGIDVLDTTTILGAISRNAKRARPVGRAVEAEVAVLLPAVIYRSRLLDPVITSKGSISELPTAQPMSFADPIP
jgi:hypothetical protein